MVVVIVAVIALWSFLSSVKSGTPQEVTYSVFTTWIKEERIDTAEIGQNGTVEGKYRPPNSQQERDFKVVVPVDEIGTIANLLNEQNVNVEIKQEEQNNLLYMILSSGFPILLFVAFWIFLMRQMQAGGNRALSFGKSRAKLSTNQQKRVTFKDVAGVEEAKEELSEIVEFLREPQKFQKLGGRIPKGLLLMGPPGTGKTLLARAIAGEANVPFFTISGSDFVEMFVGVGASRVRDLFEQGKKNAPCIIFIDEIDAVGRHRGAGLGGGHDEREQTLNALLVEMDGFESNEGVILIAATNRPDVLDPALLRPGRFDRQVVVSLPDIKGREGILKVHTRRIPLDEDVELVVLARGTPGFSGAQLANLVNEAALIAARHDRKAVKMRDFEEAKDKVLMGKERRSMVMNEKEKRNTAYHEAGHALVAFFLPEADPLHKVTIIPRGRALGVTMQLPEEDKYNYSKAYMETSITILLAGRAAEEIFLGSMTTGAANDMERSTGLARKMVCEWGMSETIGPLTFGKNEEQIFLGREISRHQEYSEKTAVKIDEETKKIVLEANKKARSILDANRDALVRLAEALLEYETLDQSDIRDIIDGKEISRESTEEPISTPEGDETAEPAEPEPENAGAPLVNPNERPATA
jgi:cell division protease FtsH